VGTASNVETLPWRSVVGIYHWDQNKLYPSSHPYTCSFIHPSIQSAFIECSFLGSEGYKSEQIKFIHCDIVLDHRSFLY
jgi:hypothetical protein